MTEVIWIRLFLPVIVAAGVTLMQILGFFGFPNGVLYDATVSLMTRAQADSVVLVEVPAGDEGRNVDDWKKTLATLSELGARKVVFAFDPLRYAAPDGASAREFSAQARRRGALIGRAVSEAGDGDYTVAAASALDASGLEWGAVLLPDAQFGINRRQVYAVNVGGVFVQSIEAAAAGRAGKHGASFLLRFPGGRRGVPHVGVDQVIAGQAPRALIEGRVALLGVVAKNEHPNISVSALRDAEAIRAAEFHAFALETLLSNTAGTQVGRLPSAAIMLIFTFVIAWLRSGGGVMAGRVATIAILVLPLALGWAALRFAGVFLPVGELLVAQAALLLIIWGRRELTQDQMLHDLARETARRVRHRLAPTEAAPEAWGLQAVSAARLLGLDRSLFLLVGRDDALAQAAAVGCSLADWSLKEGGAVGLGRARPGAPARLDRTAFRCTRDGEDAWLALIGDPGKPRGAWVFAAAAEPKQGDQNLLAAVSAAADRLSQTLPGGYPSNRRPTRRSAAAKEIDDRIRRTIELLESRADLLDQLFGDVSSAVICFDSIGQVLQSNPQIDGIIRQVGLDRATVTAVDLTARLLGETAAGAGDVLRQVLINGVSVHRHLAQLIEGRAFQMRLSPLTGEGGRRAGVFCELLDITEILRLGDLQQTLTEHLGHQLRNDVEAIQLAAGLLGDSRLNEAGRARAASRLDALVKRTVDRLNTVGEFMEVEIPLRAAQVYPIDAKDALNEAVAAMRDAAVLAKVSVSLEATDLAAPVMAARTELAGLLEALITVAIHDARSGSEVSVALRETAGSAVIEIRSEGFGLPDHILQDFLARRRRPESPELQAIVAALPELSEWGASLDARASVDVGFVFTLTLRTLQ